MGQRQEVNSKSADSFIEGESLEYHVTFVLGLGSSAQCSCNFEESHFCEGHLVHWWVSKRITGFHPQDGSS